MHGIVALLEDQYYTIVQDLWQELKQDCGLSRIEATPIPHFSWIIAEDFSRESMLQALASLAEEAKPFKVKTNGIGIFTGESPVVYIPLARTAALSTFHARVWEQLYPYTTRASLLYHPDSWMPHITIAHADVTSKNLDCAMQKLAFRSFDWELSVDSLAYISQPNGEIGKLQYQVSFEE